MSSISGEHIVTASTEYASTTVYVLNQPWGIEKPTYKPPKQELQRRLRKLQTLNISGSEDYTLSTGKVKLLVERRELLSIVESLRESILTAFSTLILRELLAVPLKEIVANALKGLGAPVLNVEVRYNEGTGLYILATLDCSARQALKYWLSIVDAMQRYDIPIFITWTGNVDVTPEEMGACIGKVLARMNMFLATKEPLDIVKILREEWGL